MLIDRTVWESRVTGYFKGEAAFQSPLKEHTSLGLGGPADVVASPDDPLSMKNIVMILRKENIPYLPLGAGTNILVRDRGIEGVVIKFSLFKRIEIIQEEQNFVQLFVEAGLPLQKLVNFCREKGYSGAEGLTGIPGTIGGAIFGNAGSYGCEMKDLILSVVILRADGSLDRVRNEDLGFGYRKSDIHSDDIIMSANLMLRQDEQKAVASRTDRFFAEKKRTQPISERSAGCVFMNPEGVSAGKLIDEAGCKGMRAGGIEVSSLHANFFLNKGKGTSADYTNLMEKVSLRVKERFGILLEPEIRIVGKA